MNLHFEWVDNGNGYEHLFVGQVPYCVGWIKKHPKKWSGFLEIPGGFPLDIYRDKDGMKAMLEEHVTQFVKAALAGTCLHEQATSE